jgi:lipid-binding SYLF domain-containing protein
MNRLPPADHEDRAARPAPRRAGTWLAMAAAASALCLGCTTLSPAERDAARAELDAMAESALVALLQGQPQAGEVLERGLGYAVIDMAVTKIPVFGVGSGKGVVVDRRTGTRSYLKVSRFEVGGGLGAQKYQVVIMFEDGALLDRAATGTWHYEAGAELAAGTSSAEGGVQRAAKGYEAYKLAEGGATATVTVRVAHAKPWLD